jgi:hypothetical protein
VNPDDFIEHAIQRGVLEGLGALQQPEQAIFAISEAEVYCDKDGIDSLLHRYGPSSMDLFARAFAVVGAVEIADTLQAIASFGGSAPEELLNRANRLITQRHQYEYESIRAFVEREA